MTTFSSPLYAKMIADTSVGETQKVGFIPAIYTFNVSAGMGVGAVASVRPISYIVPAGQMIYEVALLRNTAFVGQAAAGVGFDILVAGAGTIGVAANVSAGTASTMGPATGSLINGATKLGTVLTTDCTIDVVLSVAGSWPAVSGDATVCITVGIPFVQYS